MNKILMGTRGTKANSASSGSFNCTPVIFQAITKTSSMTMYLVDTFPEIIISNALLLGFTKIKRSKMPNRKISETWRLYSELTQQRKARQQWELACLLQVTCADTVLSQYLKSDFTPIFIVVSNSSNNQSRHRVSHLWGIKIPLASVCARPFTSSRHRVYFTTVTVTGLCSPHKHPLTSQRKQLHFSWDSSNTESWFIFISASKKTSLNLRAQCNSKHHFEF